MHLSRPDDINDGLSDSNNTATHFLSFPHLFDFLAYVLL